MSLADQAKVDNLLFISWCDSRWVPVLNANNILDYFTERSNPFYSKECNNEFLKMQQNTRIDQLQHMQGIEYMLLHAQDPILYIIRKQHRYSPTQINPLACYHIIAGQVFQTPDLGSVINSRLVSSINHINSAFTELQSFSQYHPSKGYWWQTPKQSQESIDNKKKNEEKRVTRKEEVASLFQRRRVDLLLNDLVHKFPYKPPIQQQQTQQSASTPQQQPQSQQPAQQQQQQQTTQQTTQQQQQPPTQQQQPQTGTAQQTTPQPQPQLPSVTPKSEPPINIKTEEPKAEVSKVEVKPDVKPDIKSEPVSQPSAPPQRVAKPPPEKRQKLGP